MIEVPYPTTWVRDRTILRVFNSDGKEIADYDGATGLTFILKEENGKSYITPDLTHIVPGRWEFTGVYITGGVDAPMKTNVVTEAGTKSPDNHDEAAAQEAHQRIRRSKKNPRDYDDSPFLFAPIKERDTRMSICRECPLYNHESGTCTVDNSFMALKTNLAQNECPEGKWGKASNYSDKAFEERRKKIKTPEQTQAQIDDQAAFEAKLAERLGE
jgi:hypothetical protein